jgi:glutathione peroxidase
MKLLKVAVALTLVAGFAAVGTGEDKAMTGPLDLKMKGIDGKELDLGQFKGKVVLIVNVASRCGYTKQYKGLEELYEKYQKDGLVVVGVPANDFGMQEPGTDEEIQKFCTSNYKVTFPMTAKVPTVLGANKVELYKRLIAEGKDKRSDVDKKKDKAEIGWNFEKFLIGRDGKVVTWYPSGVAPESDELIKAIKTELAKGK